MSKPIQFNPAAIGPLAGVRVIDLSRLVAGTMIRCRFWGRLDAASTCPAIVNVP